MTTAQASSLAMDWDTLLCVDRFERPEKNDEDDRSDFERDFDRILFSTPARRLAGKTQVFPGAAHDTSRTRLTHSHEAATLARAAAGSLVERLKDHPEERFRLRPEHRTHLSSLAAAAALGHDLGTPPFAHAGERAIKRWFAKQNVGNFFDGLSATQARDFLKFDANAQTIRIVLKLQAGVRYDGFNLTFGTIATLLKYPPHGAYEELGCFTSELEAIDRVRQQCGIPLGVRHPLAFLMEACDDIAYSVNDIEDSIRKGIVSGLEVMDSIERNVDTSGSQKIIAKLQDDWGRLQRRHHGDATLSDHDYAEVIAQRFRCRLIPALLEYGLRSFKKNLRDIMHGQFTKSLLEVEPDSSALLEHLKSFASTRAYRHVGVLEPETCGVEAMSRLMLDFLMAIESHAVPKPDPTSFERLVWRKISSTYRSQFLRTDKSRFHQLRLLTDMVAGMTDNFTLVLDEELRDLRPSAA